MTMPTRPDTAFLRMQAQVYQRIADMYALEIDPDAIKTGECSAITARTLRAAADYIDAVPTATQEPQSCLTNG